MSKLPIGKYPNNLFTSAKNWKIEIGWAVGETDNRVERIIMVFY
jgi:hypothetical protein